MFRVTERSNSFFSIVLILTGVLAILPTNWLAWTRDLSDIVRLPITPVAHAGNLLAGWLRPVDAVDGMNESDLRERMVVLEDERDRFKRLYHALQLRTQDLSAQLGLLQGLPDRMLQGPRPPLILPTDVTARDPGDVVSPVEVEVTPQIDERVNVGDVAIWRHEYLVGRVASRSSFRVTILPLAHLDTGPFQVAVLIPGQEEAGLAPPRMLLNPLGDGSFAGEVDHRHGTLPGSQVVLADSEWPPWAQALGVGVIESVEQIDEAPLRDLVIVRPRIQLHQLPEIILLASDEDPMTLTGELKP